MNILGVDIGYDRCGFAIIDSESNLLIDSGIILTDKSLPFPERLRILREDMITIKKKYYPEAICIEKLFFYRKNQTFEKICMSKGVALELFSDILIQEVEPLKVKNKITGIGNASKEDMREILSQRLKMNFEKYVDDEIDAICLGLYMSENIKLEKLYNKT